MPAVQIRQNAEVTTGGKRAGARRGRRKPPSFRPQLLGLAVGMTLAVVAWGYLVKAAVDFGSEARGGESDAWWFLALASVGAVACLFVGLLLLARVLRGLGITQSRSSGSPDDADARQRTVSEPTAPPSHRG